ncbi:helix-turn-helix domain-containing protein [Pollutimonas sp. H1-120]|uniref:helix-turn-helix domain-containing protein n=1 Tax=Pollutimonas sp. H1-120 TaxID=3148824 RepID=UPI003B519B45
MRNSKSTASEAQRQRILDALRVGPKTSYDLRRIGCYQTPTRILELRRMGYAIRTEFVTLYDRDGYMHPRCARYHLAGEQP